VLVEPGLEVPAFLLRPEGEVRGVAVAIDDRGKEFLASDPAVHEVLERGWAICGMDPRGVGESATDKMGWVFAVNLLLGENLSGQQACDIGRVIEALSAHGSFTGKPFGLYARGPSAALAATYAIARSGQDSHPALRWFVLGDGFLTFRSFFERPKSLAASFRLQAADRDRTTSFDHEIPAHLFAFNALRSFDMPQLLAVTPAQGLVVNPIDGDRSTLSERVARDLLPPRVRVYAGEQPELVVREFLQRLP
jgi:hypothetical protein